MKHMQPVKANISSFIYCYAQLVWLNWKDETYGCILCIFNNKVYQYSINLLVYPKKYYGARNTGTVGIFSLLFYVTRTMYAHIKHSAYHFYLLYII